MWNTTGRAVNQCMNVLWYDCIKGLFLLNISKHFISNLW